MKTISFELAKRLNEKGLLDNIETEYFIPKLGYVGNWIYNPYRTSEKNNMYKKQILKSGDEIYKTLTLEELPKFIYDIVGKEKLNKHLNSKYSALQIFNFSVNDYEKIINDLILNQK